MAKPIPQIPPDVVEALEKGHLLEAVKRLRATMPVGLAEAKSILEWHLRQNTIAVPQQGKKPPAPRPAATAAMAPRVTGRHHPTVHAPNPPGLAPGEVPRTSGGGLGIVVLLAAAMGLAYYFLK